MSNDLRTHSSKRLTAIWSRDVDPSRLAGRTQMIQEIRREISSNYRAEHLRIRNVLENLGFRAILATMFTAIKTLLRGHLPSLQCLLFCDRENHNHILRRLREDPPEILYCDGVRNYYLLQRIARLGIKFRVVVDLDDLMSRRMQSLVAADTPLSLGYLHEKVPSKLRGALALGFFSRSLARYEQVALSHVEDQIGEWADAVVLISQVESGVLQSRYRELGSKAQVYAVPPAVEIVAPPQTYRSVSRFIFIGTDALPQNKLSIQLILSLWQRLKPEAEIHIFGHMLSCWRPMPGVIFRGYVPSLQYVYIEDSVLFAPGVLRGGLKTKVAEAFAHGCAVVGNEITFEGLGLTEYPLKIDTADAMADVVHNPSAYLRQMFGAASIGQEYLRSCLSRERFEKNWHQILG